MRATHQSRPPPSSIQRDLVGEQEQRRDRRRVVGLVLERVLERRAAARGRPGSSARRRRSCGDPLLRGRAEQRQPQPAVGARSTSAARSSRRRPAETSTGRPPAPEVASISDERVARAGRAARPGTITPVEVSLCAQASTSAPAVARPARPTPAGSGASPGSAAITIGSSRNGAPVRDRRELLRELAEGEVQRALARPARTRRRPRRRSRRRCRARPRSRRAARTARAGRRGSRRRAP